MDHSSNVHLSESTTETSQHCFPHVTVESYQLLTPCSLGSSLRGRTAVDRPLKQTKTYTTPVPNNKLPNHTNSTLGPVHLLVFASTECLSTWMGHAYQHRRPRVRRTYSSSFGLRPETLVGRGPSPCYRSWSLQTFVAGLCRV